jgi:hypothetical protein
MRRWLAPAFAIVAGCAGGERRAVTPATTTAAADAGLVAVADAAPPPPIDAALPLDRDSPRLVARDIAMLHAVAAALGDAGSDCATGAARLTAVRADYADVVAADAAVLADRRGELKAALVARKPDVDAAAQAVFTSAALAACAGDATFERAFDRAVGRP